jgi:hypothetical protein
LAALADQLETPERSLAMTIISSQVAKRLFAFENRCRSRLFSPPSMRGNIGTVPTLWQAYLHRACGKSLRLRPQKGEPL